MCTDRRQQNASTTNAQLASGHHSASVLVNSFSMQDSEPKTDVLTLYDDC